MSSHSVHTPKRAVLVRICWEVLNLKASGQLAHGVPLTQVVAKAYPDRTSQIVGAARYSNAVGRAFWRKCRAAVADLEAERIILVTSRTVGKRNYVYLTDPDHHGTH